MKEAYFEPETLQHQAEAMLAALWHNRERHPAAAFSPEKAALLVLDMQTYFLDPASHAFIPSAPAVLPQVQRLALAFSQLGRPVIFTRHLNTSANASLMASWWCDLIQPDSPLSQIAPELEPEHGCVVEKSQYDAFYQTELDDILRQNQVEQVVVSGVMTHLCCETTARSAFMRGFQVFFSVDGTATYNAGFHRAALLNLSHGFAVPMLVEEIEQACHV
jgi:nicotinamidase-related amidase